MAEDEDDEGDVTDMSGTRRLSSCQKRHLLKRRRAPTRGLLSCWPDMPPEAATPPPLTSSATAFGFWFCERENGPRDDWGEERAVEDEDEEGRSSTMW